MTSLLLYRLIRAKDRILPDLWSSLVTNRSPLLIPSDRLSMAKAVVFAPHPDDEVLGCGGTIVAMASRGTMVKVVYMTDGGRGDPRSTAEEMSAIRKKEARKGLDVLGCGEPVFMDRPDGGLKADRETISRTRDLIDELGPDAVFVPYPFDNHIDHIRTAQVVAAALGPRSPVACYCYEVWSVLPPNIIVDITSQMDRKLEALAQHSSQLALLDYREKIAGLNAYRSITAGNGVRSCEAFYKCSGKELYDLVGRGKVRRP